MPEIARRSDSGLPSAHRGGHGQFVAGADVWVYENTPYENFGLLATGLDTPYENFGLPWQGLIRRMRLRRKGTLDS